jgi:flagellar assembly factor FliW
VHHCARKLPPLATNSAPALNSRKPPHFFWPPKPPGADDISAKDCKHGAPIGVGDEHRLKDGAGGDMDITTSRFGALQVHPSDILVFEQGLIGLRTCRRWVVLADGQNAALGWLQSLDDPETALGVVSPRRFVADYQLRVNRQDLAPLQLASTRDAQVVVVVSRHPEGLALNLRAPLIINVEGRRGRQVIAKDPLPVRLILPAGEAMRLSA